jgi:hypothetical protein
MSFSAAALPVFGATTGSTPSIDLYTREQVKHLGSDLDGLCEYRSRDGFSADKYKN